MNIVTNCIMIIDVISMHDVISISNGKMSIVLRNLLIMTQGPTSRNVTEHSMSKNMTTSNDEETTSN